MVTESHFGLVKRQNQLEMVAPDPDRDLDAQGRTVAEPGDTSPPISKEAEKPPPPALRRAENPITRDRDRITVRWGVRSEIGIST